MKKIMIVLAIFMLFIFGCTSTANSDIDFESGNVNYDDYIFLEMEKISTVANWYVYESNGVTIRFFAVKDNLGDVKTAFDACDVCFSEKRGYRQEGNFMVCNNCGNKFLISSLGTENKTGGGCWPGYLKNSVVEDKVFIKKSDLDAGRFRFI